MSPAVVETHDVLAWSVATEAVRQIRASMPPWNAVFSADVHASTSRQWPVPDFVLVDDIRDIKAAAEFKPPNQTKREYLTGLGQAVAYTRDFHHGLLILPQVAEDDYRIADHVVRVLDQSVNHSIPVGVAVYDPRTFSRTHPDFTIRWQLQPRGVAPIGAAAVEDSFWAKWREASPMEIGLYVRYLFQESRRVAPGTLRDRAFDLLWIDITAGRTRHWGGDPRRVQNTPAQKTGWGKNFRNFLFHIGWILGDGTLTETGLEAFKLDSQYGADSQVFLDYLAVQVLLPGKHLVLINTITEFQNAHGPFLNEGDHLAALESHLEDQGFLKRNPGRHLAAVRLSARQFLKAEKQLWRQLGLLVPYGPAAGRAYHPSRGFVFDWTRITALLTQ